MDLTNISVSIICIFFMSQGTLNGVSAIKGEFKDAFEAGNVLFAKEKMNVELSCSKTTKARVSFIAWSPVGALPTEAITLFNASHPVKKSDKYSFSTFSNIFTFTIYNIGRQDAGTYYCSQIIKPPRTFRLKYCNLEVIKIPQKNPVCSTNYRYPIIFHDEMNDKFEFNCSTETGNPSLEIDMLLNDVILPPDASRTKNGITTLSIITYMTEDLNSSTFVCSVRQELPSPYNERYEETCSFGPMHLLPGFTITISPPSAFFREEDNVTFSCRSNVSGVEKKWKNVTRGKYTIKDNDGSSDLNILELNPPLSGSIVLECQGSYGSRVVTGRAHVNTKRTRLVMLIFCLVIFVIGLLVYRHRKSNRRRQRRRKLANAAAAITASDVKPKDKSNNVCNISSRSYNRPITTQNRSYNPTSEKCDYEVSSKLFLDGGEYLYPSGEKYTQDIDVYDGVNI